MKSETAIAVTCTSLIGAGILILGIYQRRRLRTAESWPQVMGTIRKVEVIRDTSPDSSGYFISILYDYSVNGVALQGNKIGFSQRAYVRKKSAQAAADRYQPNTSVPVFFDPQKPSDAVLERSFPDNLTLIYCGAGLLTLVAVILVARG